MSIQKILEEMDYLLLNASRVPFTNKRVIAVEDMTRLVDDLRENLPMEIMEANRIINERKRILEDVQRESQALIEQAKQYIVRLTDENAITRQAQEQAGEIIAQARNQAREMQNESLLYADGVFRSLEENLEKALEVVKTGRSSLHHTKDSS
ncbi:hypothetical protein [Acetonema longum]|uniref:ATPase n=1 Tax=Acetonema longum DSM 6540 TaxID=1009370 RepID=F7NFL7_9FIRM|nr:hypothetical protein [Acetonema longum]EGO65140.1 hypothetical protein ALO_04231 [Acetonema longum DSM 6540]